MKDLESMTRAQLIRWLTIIDPNGVWTDQDSFDAGYDPLTRTEALAALRQILERD
jgi:hypothetical protein